MTDDGVMCMCRRVDDGTGEARTDKGGTPFWLYRLKDTPKGWSPPPIPQPPDATLASVEDRDRVYRHVLGVLRLEPAHRAELERRGLTAESISQGLYRTLGAQRAELARRVAAQFSTDLLLTVPGFYVKDGSDGQTYMSFGGSAGLVVPVMDRAGHVVALKVRDDNPDAEPKYTYITSKSKGGAGPGAAAHVPRWDGDTKRVRATEGEVKAAVATQLSETLTISTPGVSCWAKLLPILEEVGAEEVVLSFDADQATNPHVRRAAENAAKALMEKGYRLFVESWDISLGKGIDDVLAAGHVPTLTEVAAVDDADDRDGDDDGERRPVIRRVSDVAVEPVRWLWPSRIPRGKLTVLDGDPGLGKSTVTLDLAARVTTGAPMPDETDACLLPAGVVLLTAEDGIADTVRPRLEAAGADLTRVVVLDAVEGAEGIERPPEIPMDVAMIEEAIKATDAALVIIDPLAAFLGAQVNSYRDQDVRRALHAISKMAERTNVAVVVVRHLSKTGGGHPIYRGGGSIGIIGAARSGLLVAPDPDDEERRIVAVTKANLAAMPEALAYRLVADGPDGCARIVWEGRTGHRAADLLDLSTKEERSEIDDACDFLLDVLGRGAVAMRTVEREAINAGISKRTLRRAKEKLGVRSAKVGAPGDHGEWRWSLPSSDDDEDPAPEDVHEDPKMPTPECVDTFDDGGHLRAEPDHAPLASQPTLGDVGPCDICRKDTGLVHGEGWKCSRCRAA